MNNVYGIVKSPKARYVALNLSLSSLPNIACSKRLTRPIECLNIITLIRESP